MSFEPTEKQREAYKIAREFPKPSPISDLCDLAQHATAAAMEAEHILYQHNGILYDWFKEADEKLREKK